MSELGDLLERIHEGGRDVSAIAATVRVHTHLARHRTAQYERLRARGLPLEVDDDEPEDYGDQTTVQTIRVWLDGTADRVREEFKIGVYGVRVGKRWLTYDPQAHAVTTNEGAEQFNTWAGGYANWILRPAALLGALALEPLGSGDVDGRETLRARGVPRPGAEDSLMLLRVSGWGADEMLLDFDARHGIVLRQENRHGGEWFEIVEVGDVEIDPRFTEDVFSLAVPPGAAIRNVTDTLAEE